MLYSKYWQSHAVFLNDIENIWYYGRVHAVFLNDETVLSGLEPRAYTPSVHQRKMV